MNPIFLSRFVLKWILLLIFSSVIIQAKCEKPPKPSIFVISTEFQIGKIKHMVEKAPKGIYISVGSERSFRGASMAPHVTHVYLIDTSPEIIRYNRINSELLKAPNKEAYKMLRWEAGFEEWQKLCPSLKKDDFDWWKDSIRDLDKKGYSLPETLNKNNPAPYAPQFESIRLKLHSFYQSWRLIETPNLPERDFIETITSEHLQNLSKKLNIPSQILPEEWAWWVKTGKNKEIHCIKTLSENPAQAIDLRKIVDYKTGNYLFDDTLYERLHLLALAGKLTSMQIDLAHDEQLEKLLDLLKKEKDLISVLDLDNLYFQDYIGQEKYRMIVQRFLPLGQDSSLLIVMSNTKDYACGQFQTYIGFTFENIRHWPPFFFMQTYFDTLPPDLIELSQGRLYEKEESPPYRYLLGG